MVPICTEWWCTQANKATQTHCYNSVAPAYPVWAYYAHGRQRRCQEDPVGLPSGRLEKTTGSSPHHVAQHCPTGSETTPYYALWSSRFGSEPPSVEDDVDVWHYAIVSCMPETTTRQTVSRLLTLSDWLTFWSCQTTSRINSLTLSSWTLLHHGDFLHHDYLCTVFVLSTLYFVCCTHI